MLPRTTMMGRRDVFSVSQMLTFVSEEDYGIQLGATA